MYRLLAYVLIDYIIDYIIDNIIYYNTRFGV